MHLKCPDCADVMGMGMQCDFVAEGTTKEEVMGAGMAHIQSDHPEAAKAWMKMSSEDQEAMKVKLMDMVQE